MSESLRQPMSIWKRLSLLLTFEPIYITVSNVATIQLSPLRERPGDILPLAKHFLKIYGDRLGYDDISCRQQPN